MKKLSILLVSIISMLGLASCDQQLAAPQDFSREIKFTASIGKYATKADAFAENDAVGLTASAPVNATNVKLTVKGGVLTPAETLYWGKDQKEESAFYAVYPYSADIDPAQQFTFQIPFRQGEEESDLLIASTKAAPGAKAVNLGFTHAFSRLVANFDVKLEGVTIDSVAVAGVSTKAIVNIPGGRVAAVQSETSMNEGFIAAELAANKFAGVIAPQTAQPAIVVLMSDQSYLVFFADEALTFESGKQLVADIVIDENTVPGGGETGDGSLTFTTRVFDWFPGEELEFINFANEDPYNPGDDPYNPVTNWDYTPSSYYLSEVNIWRPADEAHSTRWIYAPAGEVLNDGPEVKLTQSTYEITFEDDILKSANGKAQLYLIPSEQIILSSSKDYCFTIDTWLSSADCMLTVKVSNGRGGVLGFPLEADMPAGSGAEFTGDDEPLALLLEFSDVPAGTTVKIKDIVIEYVRDHQGGDEPGPGPGGDVHAQVVMLSFSDADYKNNLAYAPMAVGEYMILTGLVYPYNSIDEVDFASSDESVLKVTSVEPSTMTAGNGEEVPIYIVKITAVGPGAATISITAGEECDEQEFTVVPVPEGAVNLGFVCYSEENGNYYRFFFAECNLGANAPEEAGGFYAWGETEPKSTFTRENYKWTKEVVHPAGSYDEGDGKIVTIDKPWTEYFLKKYCPASRADLWRGDGEPDGKTILDPEDDAAHVALGGKWRMPTNNEISSLNVTPFDNRYTWEWITVNGQDGYKVTYLPLGTSLFLPAAGFKVEDQWNKGGYYAAEGQEEATYLEGLGYFRSSEIYGDYPWGACGFAWTSPAITAIYNRPSPCYGDGGGQEREHGYPIRPVTE